MILPSAAPRCSSSDTIDVLVDAPSGQLRGGGSSKILPLNSGGDCVQNQFSSRAVESALPFAMALSFKEGPYLQDKGALESDAHAGTFFLGGGFP